MPQSVTILLDRLKSGDNQALDDLVPLVYPELRRMASTYLRGERKAHTLQPTALVHEAYLRLIGQEQPEYQSKAHFFGVASQVMRQILVDSARRKNAAKRGGGGDASKVTLDSNLLAQEWGSDLVLSVDEALQKLERRDERKAKLIVMRFFGGMTAEESAAVMELPVQTVRQQLRLAQAWLKRELDNTDSPQKF